MNLYPSVIFLHILSAAVLLGNSLLDVLLRSHMRRAQDMASLGQWMALLGRAARVNPAAPLVLLASGSYLASVGFWSAPWVWAAVVLFVASSVLSVGVVARQARQLGALAAAAGAGPVSAEAEQLRWSPRWEIAGNLLLANDVVALFLMTNKPGLVGSVALPLLGSAVALALHAARRRERPTATPALARDA